MKKKFLTIILIITAICVSFAGGCIKNPDPDSTVDYDSLELIWSDEFDTFDKSVWINGKDGIRRGGYWDIDQRFRQRTGIW